MNYSKKHLRRYYIFGISLMSMYVFAAILPLFFGKPLLTVLIVALLFLPVNLLIKWVSPKIFLDILNSEQNSQKFYDTVYHRPLRPSLPISLNAEWYAGNYEKLILLAEEGYKSYKNPAMKFTCLLFLSRAYFEIHDVDKLKETVDMAFELKNINPKNEKLFSQYKIFGFYKSFVEEDYESCINYVADQLKSPDINNKANKLKWFTQRMNLAICLYWQGDKQKAKEEFEYFKENTPNLKNFHDLSDRYLSAINSNDSSFICVTLDDIDKNDFEKQFAFAKTKVKKKRNFYSILIIICLVLLASIEIGNRACNIYYEVEFLNKIDRAVSEIYDDAKCVKYFYVEDIDTLCVIEHDGKLDLGSVVKGKDEETSEIIMIIENMQIPNDYSIDSVVSNRTISFYISDKRIPFSKDNKIFRFSANNKDYWIEIKSVT